jgi:hypothetical protein
MSTSPSAAKTPVRTAAEICAGYKPKPADRALLAEGMTPREFLQSLIRENRIAGAIRFLAALLPKREAVRWASLCVEKVVDPRKEPAQERALAAARAWIDQPSQPLCSAAGNSAEAAGLDSPAGIVALAAFYSGNSLTGPELPPVPPPDFLSGDMVANALEIAAVTADPLAGEAKLNDYLRIGLELAEGLSPAAKGAQGAR